MVFMPHWPKNLASKPINFGLERIEEILKRLKHPEHMLPPIVHVAGTNGKGSTVAFLRAFLEAAGYKVHVYTSPHLLNFNERIVLAGNEISDDYLAEIADECRLATEDMTITFFEGTTAMAFLAFSRVKADIVLLETGMGGRLDATNIFDKPLCTIITPISLDHMEYLGPTVQTIAREKIGILKRDVPCISSLQFDEVNLLLEEKADELNCELLSFGYDWVTEKTKAGMIYKNSSCEITLPQPGLLGDHQIVNAGTAITAAKILKNFKISDEHISDGLQDVKWPARMQQITKGKLLSHLPEGWEIWLDGAHNNAGAHIVSCIIEDWKDKPNYLICGFTRGRSAKEFTKHFIGKADFVCGVLVETELSAQNPEEIAKAANENGIEAEAFESIEEALNFLKKRSQTPARIIFCGSLYLASDAMKTNR